MNMQNQRSCYGRVLVELGKENDNIVVLEADLGKSTMTYLFQKEFPERYFEMGIAEANMVSFAAGLSLTGKTAFVNSFAVFASGRPYDQIRQSVCIGNLNVKIIGSSSGLSDFGDGATHQAVEDVALMRAIPNMTVLVPSDGTETEKMIRRAASINGPVYIRIIRNDIPEVFPKDIEFETGKYVTITDGSDVLVLANGIMVSRALEAAEVLIKEGISLKVVNISTMKPFNGEAVRKLSKGAKGIVCAEEHSLIGGLACAVTYALRGEAIPIEAVAIKDAFGQSAQAYEELLAHYGLTAGNIAAKARKILNHDSHKNMEVPYARTR